MFNLPDSSRPSSPTVERPQRETEGLRDDDWLELNLRCVLLVDQATAVAGLLVCQEE